MVRITPSIALDDRELEFAFVRSSGPGGQNVNKVATVAQLRFDARNSPSIPAEVRQRLLDLAGRRANDAGILVIIARRFRSQEQNRQDALARLVALVRRACEKPKYRRPTKPTRAAKARRLAHKRRHAERKRSRRYDAGAEG